MNERLPVPDTELSSRLGLETRRGFWTWGRSGIVALVLLVVAGGLGWRYWARPAPTVYVAAQTVRGPLTVNVSATGTLQPESQVSVGAEISGRVDAVNVDYNDAVRKGQVLAVINTDQIRAQIGRAHV